MSTILNTDLEAFIKRAAADAGFDLCGIAPANDAPDLDHFPAWIAAGRAGEMKYLEARDDQGELKRGALARVAPWARSVIVCAMNYNTAHPYSTQVNDPDRGWIARYAWSREDYHDAVLRRLKQVEAALHQPVWSGHSCPPALTTRSYVDTGPIVERVFAKYAGLGWNGKNTCLINQKKGSWLFLGVILTSLELTPDLPAPDRCGSCTRCIEACPTDALVAPYQLDSNRCIAYLTIEKRGPIAEEFRAGIGHQVFGCDICQDVCPWNRKSPRKSDPAFQPRDDLNPADLTHILELNEKGFRDTFGETALDRPGRAGLLRNAAIVMGNQRDPAAVPALEQALGDAEPVVRGAAAWALGRICGVDAVAALKSRLDVEDNATVRAEIEAALGPQ
jgi:epoxyqueuosine reductase